MRKTSWILLSLLIVCLGLAMSSAASAQVSIVIRFGPPPLPVYAQPPCPAEGFIWVPGYWAYDYDDEDYFWVPGTWVLAPAPGLLWTPGYWAWDNDRFFFHEGYWGPHVGFYGGIVYGYGYFGEGYEGGRWDGDRFFYNRSVTNVNITNIHNVYNETIINNRTEVNHVSYNGGHGGIEARPSHEEEAAAREQHIAPLEVQNLHAQAARMNPEQRASTNLGKPQIAATLKPGEYADRAVIHAKEAGAPYKPPTNPEPGRLNNKVHPDDLHPATNPGTPRAGNPQLDRQYQQEQEKIRTQQAQDRQRLQQQQELEHQRLAQQQANEAAKRQLEQKHQQETLQLARQHAQQMQKLQEKYQAQTRKPAEPPKGQRPPEKH